MPKNSRRHRENGIEPASLSETFASLPVCLRDPLSQREFQTSTSNATYAGFFCLLAERVASGQTLSCVIEINYPSGEPGRLIVYFVCRVLALHCELQESGLFGTGFQILEHLSLPYHGDVTSWGVEA